MTEGKNSESGQMGVESWLCSVRAKQLRSPAGSPSCSPPSHALFEHPATTDTMTGHAKLYDPLVDSFVAYVQIFANVIYR